MACTYDATLGMMARDAVPTRENFLRNALCRSLLVFATKMDLLHKG